MGHPRSSTPHTRLTLVVVSAQAREGGAVVGNSSRAFGAGTARAQHAEGRESAEP